VYQSHQHEEEWLYILSGRGIAEIDEEEIEVHAGDFMAFPTPSVAHHLKNPFDQHLVYLMGGENREMEIADFPKLGRRSCGTERALRSMTRRTQSHSVRWVLDRTPRLVFPNLPAETRDACLYQHARKPSQ
jgi:uncharacterized cupin superfamily protein